MAKEDAHLDYEPLSLHEQREAFQRDEPVQVGMTDGSEDPINIRSDDEIRSADG